jgi:hypothetical protein
MLMDLLFYPSSFGTEQSYPKIWRLFDKIKTKKLLKFRLIDELIFYLKKRRIRYPAIIARNFYLVSFDKVKDASRRVATFKI